MAQLADVSAPKCVQLSSICANGREILVLTIPILAPCCNTHRPHTQQFVHESLWHTAHDAFEHLILIWLQIPMPELPIGVNTKREDLPLPCTHYSVT